MANQNTKNFVDSMVDAQKQMVDSAVENTKKFTNGNNMMNETMEKGREWYQNWLEGQKNFFTKTTEQTGNTAETAQDNLSQMNEFYQNWYNTQMNWAKQMWEMNMNYMKNAQAPKSTANNMDPMSMWNNWTNTWNTWTNNANQTANWMNMMNQWQNMWNMDSWKNTANDWTGFFNQYYEMMNNTFADMQKNMQNGTAQDAYRNMINVSEGFTRFYQMWMPMWKSVQEKTFNMDMYKQWMNPEMYKDMMDKFFGFMPENSKEYMQKMTGMMQDGMKQWNQGMMNGYQHMRGMMGNMMPVNNADIFGNMLSSYNNWYGMMNNAFSPIAKMVTPNQYTQNMQEWQDIANRTAIYNMKNAELQFMVYTEGAKVMDKLAENVMQKIEKGEEINSMMALYQEWMNISDSTFVALFESDEYSKLMAEVSAMQLKLRKDIELQMEKFMVGMPVATRSEMEELYKTIYDLKKELREMGKNMEENNSEDNSDEEKTTRRTKKA